jgi:hypothetical protein
MTGLIILLAALTAIVIFDLLAQTYGVDSRPDSDDPRSPAKGLIT